MREGGNAVETVGGLRRQLFRHRWLFIIAVFSVLLFPSKLALAAGSEGLQTVYHVYMDDEHIGTVSDKNMVDDIVDRKIEKVQDDYNDLELITGETISYVSEKAFNPDVNDEDVQEKLRNDLEIKAETQALIIDGDVVGYFKNKKAISNLLNTYKANYVDEDTLKKLNDQPDDHTYKMNASDKEQPLEPGDTRIIKVSFSKDVDISRELASPDEVLTKKEGLKLLEKGSLEDEVHLVEEGEVLESIADDYGMTLDEILEINPDLTADSPLQPDQEVHVTAYHSYMDVLVEKESVDELKIPFETKIEKTDELHEGEKEVAQEGKDGKEEVSYTIREKNGKQVHKEVKDYHVVEKPKKKIVRKGTKVTSSPSHYHVVEKPEKKNVRKGMKETSSHGTDDISWPVDGGYISSHVGERWGRMHKGVDIARPNSRTITAANHGVVTEAGYAGGYGNKIVINHNNGMKTVYAHLSSIDVQVGQTVERGQSIGIMGSTGHSTGLHLHFELYVDGALKNPTEYVQQ